MQLCKSFLSYACVIVFTDGPPLNSQSSEIRIIPFFDVMGQYDEFHSTFFIVRGFWPSYSLIMIMVPTRLNAHKQGACITTVTLSLKLTGCSSIAIVRTEFTSTHVQSGSNQSIIIPSLPYHLLKMYMEFIYKTCATIYKKKNDTGGTAL